MPLSLASMLVHIKADTKDAETGLKRVGGLFSAVGVTASGGAALVMGGVQEIVGAMKDWVSVGEANQDVVTKLNATLRSTKNAAGLTSPELQKMAANLALVTKYDDETWMSSQNVMLGFTKIGKEVFPKAQAAAADLSEKWGIALPTASRLLSLALNDPANGIGRLTKFTGRLTEEQTKNIQKMVEHGNVMGAQMAILDLLNAKEGGMATDAAKTLSGSMTILRNTFDEVKESLGLAFIPALTQLAQAITPVVSALSNDLVPVLAPFSAAFISIVNSVLPLFKMGMEGVAGLLIQVGQFVVPLITAALNFLGDAWKQLQPVVMQLLAPLTSAGGVFQNLLPVLISIGTSVGVALVDAFTKLAPFIGQIADLFTGQIVPIFITFLSTLTPLIPALADLAARVLTNLIPGLQQLLDALAPVMPILATALINALISLTPMIVDLAYAFSNDIVPAIVPIIGYLSNLVTEMSNGTEKGETLKSFLFALALAIGGVKVGLLVGDMIKLGIQFVQTSIPLVTHTAHWIAHTAAVVADKIATGGFTLVGLIAELIVSIPHIVAQTVAWWANAAAVIAATWPILAIIVAIAAVIAIIILIVTHLDWFRSSWNTVSRTVTDVGRAVWASITEVWNRVTGFLSGVWKTISGGVKSGWDTFTSTIGNALTGMWNAILNMATKIKDAMLKPFVDAKNAIGGIVQGFMNMIPGPIKGALHGIIPGFAAGVTNFSGGVATVGEHGAETLYLPPGSAVIPRVSPFGAGPGYQQGASGETYNIYVTTNDEAAIARSIVDAQKWHRILHS